MDKVDKVDKDPNEDMRMEDRLGGGEGEREGVRGLSIGGM